MTIPRPAPVIAQLPDGSAWAVFNMPESSPLFSATFTTRREAEAALIYERTKQAAAQIDPDVRTLCNHILNGGKL